MDQLNVQICTLCILFLAGKICHLTESQTEKLRSIFKANVALRRELKKRECEQAIQEEPCLKSLDWKKIKNTVHNWITLEKRKAAC